MFFQFDASDLIWVGCGASGYTDQGAYEERVDGQTVLPGSVDHRADVEECLFQAPVAEATGRTITFQSQDRTWHEPAPQDQGDFNFGVRRDSTSNDPSITSAIEGK